MNPDDILRIGVLYADGTKVTNISDWQAIRHDPDPDGPVLLPTRGSGDAWRWEGDFWLWPLPPDGPVTFVIEWPAFGIRETRAVLESEDIQAAAQEAKALWPT